MRSISDHPDDFDPNGLTAEAMRMDPKRSWRRFGRICPKQSGAKRTCGLPVN
jgi:hypothetical protein